MWAEEEGIMRADISAILLAFLTGCSVQDSERIASGGNEDSVEAGGGGAGASCGRDDDCAGEFVCAAGRCIARLARDGGLQIGDAGAVSVGPTSGNPLDSGLDGACESPEPRACNALHNYLEHAPTADGSAVDFGAGDLTLLVIFDKSGSMAMPWDRRIRWQAASDSMVAGMAPYLDNLTIGAVLFPKPDECEVAPLEDPLQINFVPGRQFISEWVESACLNQPNGSTPMELAFRVADQAILGARSLGLLEERFRVVLVTDGEPNCGTQSQLLPVFAATWLEQFGVETWVIGLPGSEGAANLLDAIAQAGGTTKHTPASNPCQFKTAVGAAAK
jgi:hypothetical protein